MSIPGYRILGCIGSGGMADVFLAERQGRAGFVKRCAIKRIRPSLADERAVTTFLDEARLAAGLSHPNLVQVYELGDADGLPYIAMEFVGCGDLHQLLCARGPLPPWLAAALMHDIALALAHAHAATDRAGQSLGLVHRDVKPKNILLTAAGQPKLTDFGVALARDRLLETASAGLKGTFGYMSPEACRGVRVDGRADQFSLGVTFWELLTGRNPFAGLPGLRKLEAICDADVPAPSDAGVACRPELDDVIGRLLAKDPDQRFPSALAVAQRLEEIATLHGEPLSPSRVQRWLEGAADPIPPRRPVARSIYPARPAPPRRKRSLALATATAVGLALGCAALLLQAGAPAASASPGLSPQHVPALVESTARPQSPRPSTSDAVEIDLARDAPTVQPVVASATERPRATPAKRRARKRRAQGRRGPRTEAPPAQTLRDGDRAATAPASEAPKKWLLDSPLPPSQIGRVR